MSKRIVVRLSNAVVNFIDDLVRSRVKRSRSSGTAKALERERRRALVAKDAEILAREGSDQDLDALAEYVAHTAVGLQCT